MYFIYNLLDVIFHFISDLKNSNFYQISRTHIIDRSILHLTVTTLSMPESSSSNSLKNCSLFFKINDGNLNSKAMAGVIEPLTVFSPVLRIILSSGISINYAFNYYFSW
ncbi:hypothetical protein HZS_3310, partial [Henneguya salminicola]